MLADELRWTESATCRRFLLVKGKRIIQIIQIIQIICIIRRNQIIWIRRPGPQCTTEESKLRLARIEIPLIVTAHFLL